MSELVAPSLDSTRALSSKIDMLMGEYNLVQKNLDKAGKEKEKIQTRLESIEEAQILLQTAATETQEQLRYHIEDMVQAALDTCFPGSYDFKAEFVIRAGRSELSLYLDKDGEKIMPQDATGGGVVDIISFTLRLVCWSLSNTDNVIVLDEPFKFMSVNLRPLAGKILKKLSSKLKLQIIMVTHDEEMIDVADKVFEVNKKSEKSKIKVAE